jgi:hypothetical protein
MINDSDEPKNESRAQTTILKLSMSADDAERLRKALAEGSLECLGISNIKEVAKPEAELTKSQWSEDYFNKKSNRPDCDSHSL